MKVLIANRSKLLIDFAKGLISKHNISQAIINKHGQFIDDQINLSAYEALIMFNLNGILDFSEIKKALIKNRQLNILVVCFNIDSHVIIELARLGVKGLIDGAIAGKKEFVKAVNLVGNKESYYSESIQEILMTQLKMKSTIKNESSNTISERELLVLKLVSDGYSNTEIANKIQISQFTVKNHRNKLLKKMKVKNTAQMIKKSYENKILMP